MSAHGEGRIDVEVELHRLGLVELVDVSDEHQRHQIDEDGFVANFAFANRFSATSVLRVAASDRAFAFSTTHVWGLAVLEALKAAPPGIDAESFDRILEDCSVPWAVHLALETTRNAWRALETAYLSCKFYGMHRSILTWEGGFQAVETDDPDEAIVIDAGRLLWRSERRALDMLADARREIESGGPIRDTKPPTTDPAEIEDEP